MINHNSEVITVKEIMIESEKNYTCDKCKYSSKDTSDFFTIPETKPDDSYSFWQFVCMCDKCFGEIVRGEK